MPDSTLNWWSVVLVGRGKPIDSITVTQQETKRLVSLSGFRFCFGSFQGRVVRLLFAWWLFGGWLESVAAPVDRDNLGVMEQAVEYRAGGGYIAEQFAPFFDGSVGSHHGGTVFVATHDDLQEDFAGFCGEDFQPHIVNEKEVWFEIFFEQTSFAGQGPPFSLFRLS
jgi:hypothetical protein